MWRGVPLWLKLVSSLVGLVAVALALNGLVGVRLVRSYLVDRLDEQLAAAAEPTEGEAPDTTPELPSPFYVSLVSPSGRVLDERWSPTTPEQAAPALPSLTLDDARALGGRPFTVDGSGGGSGWRVVAEPLGERAGSLVVARSLDDVDAATDRLTEVSVLAGLALLGLLAAAGYLVVHRALGPLPGIEDAAVAMVGGSRIQRAPEADPGTELGRIGRAFNEMANRLHSALERQEHAEGRSRQSERRLRHFVADATHELRAPLTSLRGCTEAFRQDAAITDPVALGDLLRRIEQESLRMGRLVDDLLLLARLDQQRPQTDDPVDLASAARDAAASARVVAFDRAIVYVGPDEPLLVAGDDSRLRHVVTNLVDNAVEHTPAGTQIDVEVGRARRDGRSWAELAVRDRGPGLTPDQAERVFDRFYRTDQARRRPGGGSGLGLAIVDAIVTAHGGIVEVDISSRDSTTFRVLLPVPEEPEVPSRLPVPVATPRPRPGAVEPA